METTATTGWNLVVGSFRKKPVEIQAVPVTRVNVELVARWCNGVAIAPDATAHMHGDKILFIDTLEGRMFADEGDWIIRGVAGEFYPCKPDIFTATYDEVR